VVALTVVGCSRSAKSHFNRGNAFLEKGDQASAVLEFRSAIEKDPKFAPARLKLAEIYVQQGNGARRARRVRPGRGPDAERR